MKQKYFILVSIIVATFGFCNFSQAGTVLEGNVSKIEEVPENFYGTWVVSANVITNSNPNLYDSSSTDVWTLSREGNIIILCNPITGAVAAVSIEEVDGNRVKFSRISETENEIGSETPELTLNGDFFDGTDKMVIKKYKNKKFFREDRITYRLKGKKIANCNLFE